MPCLVDRRSYVEHFVDQFARLYHNVDHHSYFELLMTKLPGEHQPSIPAQRAQVLPQQSKKQSNHIRNISNMSGQRF